jgi:hypothetical protein
MFTAFSGSYGLQALEYNELFFGDIIVELLIDPFADDVALL